MGKRLREVPGWYGRAVEEAAVFGGEAGVAQNLGKPGHDASLQKVPCKKRKDEAIQGEKNGAGVGIRFFAACMGDAGT